MSIFQDHNFGYNKPVRDAEYWADLRRRANANLSNPQRTVKTGATKDRRTELEKASSSDIMLGKTILLRREAQKHFNRLMRKGKLDGDDLGWAEELQGELDRYDEEVRDMTYAEQTRCVRLWNKSQKVRYKLP